MKSIVEQQSLTLTIISKNNKVESYIGSDVLKSAVKPHFNKSIEVTAPLEDNGDAEGTIVKTLHQGDEGYILAVLIDVVKIN